MDQTSFPVRGLDDERLAASAPKGETTAAPAAGEPAHDTSGAAEKSSPAGEHVVPFPGAAAFADARSGSRSLSPGEHNAFRELARRLTARLQSGESDDAGSDDPTTTGEIARG